jgi:hypothetical protein
LRVFYFRGEENIAVQFRFGLPAIRLLAVVAVVATLLHPIPACFLDYHPAYGVPAALGAAPLLAWSLRDALRKFPDWGPFQRRLKWTMLAGMIAILAGVRL